MLGELFVLLMLVLLLVAAAYSGIAARSELRDDRRKAGTTLGRKPRSRG